jgi:thiamine pyrophosphokinase
LAALPLEVVLKTLALIANGTISDYSIMLPQIENCDEIIAVDRGLIHCNEMEITPDLILGDFDSIDPQLLAQYAAVPQKQFPVEKDETDLELAVAYGIAKGFKKIILFGAFGKRLDHTMNNVYLLARHPEVLSALTEEEEMFAVRSKKTFDVVSGKTISIVPLFSDATVSTKGLKWELNSHVLNYHFISQSNIAIDEKVTIDVTSGIVLMTLLHAVDPANFQ